jgi:HSP20 family protein
MPMSLLRFDPFRDMERLAGQAWGRRSWAQLPPMDAVRRPEELVLRFDLPGIDPAAVDVTVEKNVLTVAAEWPSTPHDSGKVIAAERPAGRFSRRLYLGDGLDTEHVQATYDAGVLTLAFPVADEVKARRIEIHSGEANGRAVPASAGEAPAQGKAA